VCVPSPDTAFGEAYSVPPDGSAPVCQAYPEVDAAFPLLPDAGSTLQDAGSDAPADAGLDATILDAGPDATLSDGGPGDAASE
jgi:hypothetical protein